jgi:uncharacterized heparinase superfamily protein
MAGVADRSSGLAIRPRDFRPGNAPRGAQVMAGEFAFRGETVAVGPGGDPWARLAPSAAFAAALHGFDWMGDLLALGEDGAREALRLWSEWRRVFGKHGGAPWAGLALERRVFNLACSAPALAPLVSEADGAAYVESLARQARHLAAERGDPDRAGERAVVAALASAALAGKPAAALLNRSLDRVAKLVPQAVLRDGVHASRSPERGLELLFDLLALDDALSQRGAPSPLDVSRSIDRLSGAARFFALGDGRVASFHGGEGSSSARVAAALALDPDGGEASRSAPYGAFHRLEGRGIQLIVDTGRPPEPAWSAAACAQLGALAVAVDGRRLVLGSAWSAHAEADEAHRGPPGGSCLQLGEDWAGVSIRRDRRLAGGPAEVKAERRHHGDAVWLDIAHDGWRPLGFGATRRLYLDAATGDLRGEDALTPIGRPRAAGAELTLRFHLDPEVGVQLAPGGKSALLRPGAGHGWRLRSDAEGLRLAQGVAFEAGAPRPTQVLMLTGFATPADGARVRWRLSRDEG